MAGVTGELPAGSAEKTCNDICATEEMECTSLLERFHRPRGNEGVCSSYPKGDGINYCVRGCIPPGLARI